MELKQGSIFYDIYASEVVPLEYVDVHLSDNYSLFINRATNKAVSVFNNRINELFKTELDARTALDDRLFSELMLNRERIKELK